MKVKRYLQKLRNYKSNRPLWAECVEKVSKIIGEYQKRRDTKRTWIHVDLDMFYAAVELRDKPQLKNKPVAVGDIKMVTTANYIARKYGVKSAVPGYLAKKLCPHLVFVKPDYNKYR